MKTKIIKWCVSHIIFILAAAATGTALLCLAYLIPEKAMQKNFISSADQLLAEGDYLRNGNGTTQDNYTDGSFINVSSISPAGGSLLKRALMGYFKKTEESTGNGVQNLAYYSSENVELTSEYVRFWNGYVLIIKPLLCLMDYGKMRILNIIALLILLILSLFAVAKHAGPEYLIPYGIALFSIHMETIAVNLFFSTYMYILFISLTVFLMNYDTWKDTLKMSLFFECVGILIAYFTMNMFQLMILGFLLIFFFIKTYRDPAYTWKTRLLKGISYAFSWGIGYAGMIIMKFITAWIFTGYSIKENINRILFRTSKYSANGHKISYSLAVKNSLFEIRPNHILTIILIAFFAVTLILILLNVQTFISHAYEYLIYILIAAMPFVRTFLVLNHTYIHSAFVYRIYAISLFAILTCLTQFDKEAIKG